MTHEFHLNDTEIFTLMTPEFYLNDPYPVVFVTVIVHNGDVVVPDVKFLGVTARVTLPVGHQCGHVEDH